MDNTFVSDPLRIESFHETTSKDLDFKVISWNISLEYHRLKSTKSGARRSVKRNMIQRVNATEEARTLTSPIQKYKQVKPWSMKQ